MTTPKGKPTYTPMTTPKDPYYSSVGPGEQIQPYDAVPKPVGDYMTVKTPRKPTKRRTRRRKRTKRIKEDDYLEIGPTPSKPIEQIPLSKKLLARIKKILRGKLRVPITNDDVEKFNNILLKENVRFVEKLEKEDIKVLLGELQKIIIDKDATLYPVPQYKDVQQELPFQPYVPPLEPDTQPDYDKPPTIEEEVPPLEPDTQPDYDKPPTIDEEVPPSEVPPVTDELPPFDDEQPTKFNKETRKRGKLSKKKRKTRKKIHEPEDHSMFAVINNISLLDVTKFTTVLLMNVLGDFTQNIIEPYENKYEDTSLFEETLKSIIKPERYFK